eukprot:gene10792-20080_t
MFVDRTAAGASGVFDVAGENDNAPSGARAPHTPRPRRGGAATRAAARREQFPRLSALARSCMGARPTSANAERGFSHARNLVDPLR